MLYVFFMNAMVKIYRAFFHLRRTEKVTITKSYLYPFLQKFQPLSIISYNY
jgi:hypothetical protein